MAAKGAGGTRILTDSYNGGILRSLLHRPSVVGIQHL